MVEEHKAKRIALEERRTALMDGAFEQLADETIEETLKALISNASRALVLLKTLEAELCQG